MTEETVQLPRPREILGQREFRSFLIGRFCVSLSVQIQVVLVQWQVYRATGDPLALGLIGLLEAVPSLAVVLFGGHIADRYVRRNILLVTTGLLGLLSFSLVLVSDPAFVARGGPLQLALYAVVFLIGIVRGFYSPALSSLLPIILPRRLYPMGSAMNSSVFHLAASAGPAAGGLLYAYFGPQVAYGANCGLVVFAMMAFVSIRPRAPLPSPGGSVWTSIGSGIRFVRSNEKILGAMTLDLFAVLFGGAVALLPIFADTILHVGPEGLGILRAAPAGGALLMAVVLAIYPPVRRTGKKFLVAVSGFGLCMFGFALSQNFYLSVGLLFLSGLFDSVSVVIRQTIMQLYVPDHLRGKVASVNSIFIGSSNELGAFESGLTAKFMGAVASVLFGSAMTQAVVLFVGYRSRELRALEFEPAPRRVSGGGP